MPAGMTLQDFDMVRTISVLATAFAVSGYEESNGRQVSDRITLISQDVVEWASDVVAQLDARIIELAWYKSLDLTTDISGFSASIWSIHSLVLTAYLALSWPRSDVDILVETAIMQYRENRRHGPSD